MSESRKNDHINMSFTSIPECKIKMHDLNYEPLLSPHPRKNYDMGQSFLNYHFDIPLWISSMTGGTEKAYTINHNLARACGEFQLGMGLGSCRPLLNDDSRLKDFDVKHLMEDNPLFTNLGIAQLESLIDDNDLSKVTTLHNRLNADGLIIHVNPLQEWCQAEGDRYKRPAIETIKHVCDHFEGPIIVKEVGQGMGPKSLSALIDLPIAAIELAGYGGTNFSILEHRRQHKTDQTPNSAFGYVGHTAEQMIGYLNTIKDQQGNPNNIEIIISGGIKDPVNGHILNETLQFNSVIGMAGNILKYAMGDYSQLQDYLFTLRDSLAIAKSFIR